MVSAKNAEGLPHSRIGHYSRQENEHVRPIASSALSHDEFCRAHGTHHRSAPTALLWTDAFAVCNFLGLERAIGDRQYRDLAVRGRRRAPSVNSIGTIHNNDFRNRLRLPIISSYGAHTMAAQSTQRRRR